MTSEPGPAAARAKVNLYLHVTGRRGDGYHELDSLFVRVNTADRLWISPSDADGLSLSGPFANGLEGDAPENNLVMGAVDAVRREVGHAGHFHVRLEKNLPVAAGLGGGSADAAAALKAILNLLDSDLDPAPFAQALGADVAPCLHDIPILVSGIGEMIRPAPTLPAAAMVLINPGVKLATPAVFSAREGAFSSAQPLDSPIGDFRDFAAELGQRGNDLETAACGLAPVIREILDALDVLPEVALARMSGSGATCFGLTRSLADAECAAEELRLGHPDWWIEPAEIVRAEQASPLPMTLTSR